MGERKKITLNDIAEAAGVSIATVDRVFNKRARVRQLTQEKVMEVVRRLKAGEPVVPLKPTVSPPPLRFDVVLHSGRSFVNTMEETARIIGQGFSRYGVTFRTHRVLTFDSRAIPQLLLDIAKETDGIALVCREHPAVTATVNRVVAGGIPVVTLTTDLPETRRLGYVGMNQVSAGRTAGYLMGRFIGPRKGEVILVVSGSYRSQEEREMGFRRVLREEFPNLSVRETINSDDRSKESYERMRLLFETGCRPLGVYNVAGGNTGLANAIAEFGLTQEISFIGHELNDNSHWLLTHGQMDAVIDHDTRAEVFMGTNLLLSHYGRELVQPAVTPTAPVVVLRENVADVYADRENRWRDHFEGHWGSQAQPDAGSFRRMT